MKKRITALLFCAILLIVSVLPASAASRAEDGTERTVVVACSDFQNPAGDEAGAETVKSILTQIRKTRSYADGFICCGDYSCEIGIKDGVEVSTRGLNALKSAVRSVMTSTKDFIFVQGNHDLAESTEGISATGAHDTDAYGVFVINEDDYPQGQNASYMGKTVQKTAEALESYLAEKEKQNWQKPIFVASHLPLAYSMRSYYEGDGRYASYLFDVLNKYGEKGLCIVYLYGHDHSNGWENYLGASSVFLKAGDPIMIADPAEYKGQPTERTLAFTYLNAGYVGYYDIATDDHTEVDCALTMTVFAFADGEMEISRFDQNGRHTLKSEGFANRRHEDGDVKKPLDFETTLGYYTPNKTVVETATVKYTAFSDVKRSGWYYPAVNYAVQNGLFNGITKTTFEPNRAMTRGMLVTVLWRLEGQPETAGKLPFSDVKASQYYAQPILWASSCGIVNGIGDGKFDPDGNVTREQIAKIMFGYAALEERNTGSSADITGYPDYADVSSWARSYLAWANAEGLIGGTDVGGVSYLDPKGNATRAQVATILARFLQPAA